MTTSTITDMIFDKNAKFSFPVVVMIVTAAVSVYAAYAGIVNRLDNIEQQITHDRWTYSNMREWVEQTELVLKTNLPSPAEIRKDD